MSSDRQKILDKVKKLMALTSSPEKEEARTAAMMAVSLIKKHDLLTKKVETWTSSYEPPPPPPRPASRPEPPPPPPPPPPNRSSGASSKDRKAYLRREARAYVYKTFLNLRVLSMTGHFPIISATDLAIQAQQDGIISKGNSREFEMFRVYANQEFQKLRNEGHILGKRGRSGGYHMNFNEK